MAAETTEPATTGQIAQSRIGRDGKKRRKRAAHAGPLTTSKELKKQIDHFTTEWDHLNDWQRRYFVKLRKDGNEGIIAILNDIDNWQGPPGEQPAEPAEPQDQPVQQAQQPAQN